MQNILPIIQQMLPAFLGASAAIGIYLLGYTRGRTAGFEMAIEHFNAIEEKWKDSPFNKNNKNDISTHTK